MTDNEIIREVPFEKSAECFKKDVKEYFDCYKKKSDGEDCIEVCLIRGGYRTVLKAEQEINRQRAEIERLREMLISDGKTTYAAEAEKQAWHARNSEFIRQLESEIEDLKDINEHLNVFALEAREAAIKEFAERLKSKEYETSVDAYSVGYIFGADELDDLVKEMTEEKK